MKGSRQKKIIIGLYSICFFANTMVFAQKNLTDTSVLDEIVVTATRTERKLSNVAIPTTVISNRIIQLSGSLRLNEICRSNRACCLQAALVAVR